MCPVRRAVIDVGTNSTKLLVAEVSGRDVHPLLEDSHQTRLGAGFYEKSELQPEPIARTAEAVAAFAEIAKGWHAESTRVIATSAARDAVNSAELTKAVEKAAGLRVEIISGEREAEWVFRGVTTDPELAACPLLLLDVGGGSTEFILGHGDQKHFQRSVSLGTVRLFENLPHSDPPKPDELESCRQWTRKFLSTEVKPELETAMRNEANKSPDRRLKLVGTGGTASILARMEKKLLDFDRAKIEGLQLSLDRLRWHVNHLWSLPLARRKETIGLPPKRADVILTGVAIYEAILDSFGFEELRVSTRGLRFAAVMEPA